MSTSQESQPGRDDLLSRVHCHVRLGERGKAVRQHIDDLLGAGAISFPPPPRRQYCERFVFLDWDHQLPSQIVLFRIYAAYEAETAKKLRAAIAERDRVISEDDLYPEFDLPDYGELDADEQYLAVYDLEKRELGNFHFFADWRREVDEASASKALDRVRSQPSYLQTMQPPRDPQLGDALVIGWAPPCLMRGERWGLELWLLEEFNGQRGRARVFMVDLASDSITTEYETEVQLG